MTTTIPESHTDLLTAPVASLATLGRDGGPQATLVWFVYDESDGKFKVSSSTERLKTKNMLKRPQVSLLILDPHSPMRFLDVRGTVSTEVDEDYAWATANVGPKYDADVRSFDAPGTTRLVVTIEPTNIYAVDQRG
jgi:PPOX class probable F420-dependent enzyme